MPALDESFNGRSVTLRVGEGIEIALAENASSGFRWGPPPGRPATSSPILREVDETFAAPGRRPGMPGVRSFRFAALAPGSADLELEYRRAWQASAPAARGFRLRVEVLAAAANA
jgi:inhibitor of cysteine peptidase